MSSLSWTAFSRLPGKIFQSTFYWAVVDPQKISKMFWREHSQMPEGFPVWRERFFIGGIKNLLLKWINFESRFKLLLGVRRDTAGLWLINPLTPVPPVTARDEPWPFFHFWHHNFWPKLASSILNFCRRKISFQWCLVHSDQLIGAWNMPKNAKKYERKRGKKIQKSKSRNS